MSERPSFERIYLSMAFELAKRSTCSRLQVGCVIASEDFRQILSVGYNGNASGLDNHCDREEPGACGCLHAESNAAISCTTSRQTSKVVLCTNLPCPMCAKMLINLGGVKKVVYGLDYRVREGLDMLDRLGIAYEQLKV